MGAGLGFSTTLSTLYIMEVATPQMRSGLAVVPAVAGTLGVLYCQVKMITNQSRASDCERGLVAQKG